MGDVDWFGLRSLFLSEDGWTPFSVTNTSPDVPDLILHFSHQLSVIGAADDGIRMFGTQAVLENPQRTLVHLFSVFQFLLGLVQYRQVVEGHGNVRMPRSEELFLDRQRSLVKAFRFLVVTPTVIQRRQVIQVHGDFVVFLAIDVLKHRQRPNVELLRFVVLLLSFQDGSQGRYVRCHTWMIRA